MEENSMYDKLLLLPLFQGCSKVSAKKTLPTYWKK